MSNKLSQPCNNEDKEHDLEVTIIFRGSMINVVEVVVENSETEVDGA